MTDPEKTVFLSYRREPSKYLAAYVYKDLVANGYDVFWDISGINTGDFAQAILNQIAARVHFVVLLSPDSLRRCSEPGDWLRREIEHAMDTQRNIIPLVTDGFSFASPDIQAYLTGKLENLPRYQALTAPYEYLDEAIGRLKTRYLIQPKHPVMITPAPPQDSAIIERKQAEAAAQPKPTERELTAEEYFQRAFGRDFADLEGRISDYTEAIRLDPTNAAAYNNRGVTYQAKGKLDEAIADYSEAIRLNPNFERAYSSRGLARYNKGDFEGAIADCNTSIRLNTNYAPAYETRGQLSFEAGKYLEAREYFKRARALMPYYAFYIAGLAIAHHRLGNPDEAKALWESLVEADGRYLQVNWVQKKLRWRPALMEAAKELIEAFQPQG